jgi:hypothetical protein
LALRISWIAVRLEGDLVVHLSRVMDRWR